MQHTVNRMVCQSVIVLKKKESVINPNKPSRSLVIIYMICKLASLWMITMHTFLYSSVIYLHKKCQKFIIYCKFVVFNKILNHMLLLKLKLK